MSANTLYDSTENVLKQINKYIDIRMQYLEEKYRAWNVPLNKREYDNLYKKTKEYIISHIWKDLCIYSVWDDNELASIGLLNIYTKAPCHFLIEGRYGLVNGIFTYEKYRRKGYASKIVEMMQNDAKLLGLGHLEMNISEGSSYFFSKFDFYNEHEQEYMKWRSTFI